MGKNNPYAERSYRSLTIIGIVNLTSLQQQLEQLSHLPCAKQHFVSNMLDSVFLKAGRGARTMTRLELQLDLPDRLARDALAAGLLTPKALRGLLKDAMQRHASQELLAGAKRASEAGSKPLSMRQLQAEVNAVRRDTLGKTPSGT